MSNGWGSTTDDQDGGAGYSNNASSYNGFDDGYNTQGNTYGSGHAGQSGSYGSSSQNMNNSTNQGIGSGWQSSSATDQSNQSNPRHWQEPSASERQEPRFELDNGPICQNYLAGRCNLGASCRYRHQLPNTDYIPQAREVDPNNYHQRSSSVVSASNATPIGGHRFFGGEQQQYASRSTPGDQYRQDGQQQGSSNGWNMQRREPAGWGHPPPPGDQAQRPQEQTNDGWPAPRNLSSGYVAPIGSQEGPSSNTGYASPAQQQSSYSGRPIADNAPPDGGRGWVGEGRQSSRFSAPVEDRYSAAAEKLQAPSQAASGFSSGWQTISSDEHEARSAVSRKSSRYEAKPLATQSEPIPPLPDLPIAKLAQTFQQQTLADGSEPRPAAAPSSTQGYAQQPQQSQGTSSGIQPQSSQSNHASAPQASSSDWISTGPADTSSAGPLERPPSQARSYSRNEPAQSHGTSVSEGEQSLKQPAAVPAESTVRHGLPGSSRPEPDEVWVLKDYNAMRNNMWSPTLRSPRVTREEKPTETSGNRSILVSLDDYKESSESRAAADGVADQGAREAAPIVPAHHEHRQQNLDQSSMSVAGESIRPSESASNVGGSVASDDDNRTMRSPSRSMHGPSSSSSRSGKFRTFSSRNSNAGDGTGSSSPMSNFDDNPNATTTGWDPVPPKPLANPSVEAQLRGPQSAQPSIQADIARELPPHQHEQQSESRREPEQQYSNGWQPANNGNHNGWNATPAQPPLPAPTPRQSSSASYAAVNDLERAATPRAARSTVSSSSRISNVHPHQQQSAPSERAATPSISIKGASKFHAESNDLRDQLAQAHAKIVNYERRLTLSLQELESEKLEMMAMENRRLRERIAVLEDERNAVKAALVPALKILSSSGASKKSSSVVGAAAAPMQNVGRATPVRVKQETPVVNGWN